jgi:hypothetical protein
MSVFVSVALVIQDAKGIHCTILSGGIFRLYYIFPHYPIKGTIFEKKIIERKTFVLILSVTFV